VWVEQFAAGGFELKGLAATAADATALATMSALFGPVDGFLGMEALRDTVIELDFPKRQVNVVKPGTGSYPEERAMAYRGGQPRGDLEVAGRTVPVALDSAANGGFELPVLDELPLRYPATKIDAVGVGRLAERSVRGQLAGEARLGPVTWVRPPISRRPMARIGTVALSQWRVAIDQRARKIYFLDGNLQRVANEVRPPEAEFKAGYYARLEGGDLRLAEVDEGGAFHRAGLRAGDLILSVDARPGAEYVRLPGFFSARSNPRPKVRVLREGAEFEAQLVLARETPASPTVVPALR
jgi:hypothetical protein